MHLSSGSLACVQDLQILLQVLRFVQGRFEMFLDDDLLDGIVVLEVLDCGEERLRDLGKTDADSERTARVGYFPAVFNTHDFAEPEAERVQLLVSH